MSLTLTLLAWLAAAAWAWLLALRGGFWRIEPPPRFADPPQWPEVVALIPARDEAAVIGETVRSLLSQDYPGRLSVVVVDDNSGDGTAEVARRAAEALGQSERLTVVPGTPLPPGWAGKMWAQAQGAEAAATRHPEAGLWLLSDADIGHAPGTLRQLVARLEAQELDLASLMVRLSVSNPAERLVVPAFVFFFRLLYPFSWVADPRRATAAAAGGYLLVRRRMMEAIGGFAAIRGALIDDCALAAAVKGRGGRLWLGLAEETTSLRVYPDWRGLWDMIARSAYTQLNHSPLLLAGTTLALLIGLALPPLAVLWGLLGSGPGGAVLPAALAWAEMALAYRPMLRYTRLSPWAAPVLPLVGMFYLGATLDSARRHWLGRGGAWKGRVMPAGPRG